MLRSFPNLFKDKSPEDTVRAWVCGVTGEEAYSIAILLDEFGAKPDARRKSRSLPAISTRTPFGWHAIAVMTIQSWSTFLLSACNAILSKGQLLLGLKGRERESAVCAA